MDRIHYFGELMIPEQPDFIRKSALLNPRPHDKIRDFGRSKAVFSVLHANLL